MSVLDKKIFGQNLRKWRRERKASVIKLAKAVGVTYTTIYKWENGKSAPKLINLVSICKFLKVKLNDLLGWDKS